MKMKFWLQTLLVWIVLLTVISSLTISIQWKMMGLLIVSVVYILIGIKWIVREGPILRCVRDYFYKDRAVQLDAVHLGSLIIGIASFVFFITLIGLMTGQF